MALPSYFFSQPLVGPNTRNNDGIDPAEILNFLFKKNFGVPNVYPYIGYDGDRPGVFNSTKITNNTNLNVQIIPNLNENIPITQVNNWINTGWTYSSTDDYGAKYTSDEYPYLAYYSNILMKSAGLNTNSYFCGNGQTDQIVATNFSKNAIPNNFGDYYFYRHILTTSNGISLENANNGTGGSWLLDTDSGVLTFYDTITVPDAIVNRDTPPRISYWRYEGLTGNANIVEVFDA